MVALVRVPFVPVLLAAASLALAGCLAQPRLSPEFSSEIALPYRLDSGDRLRVIVFGQQDLSGSYNVDAAGNLSMPLIGQVRARGATTAEIRARVSAMLARDYLRDPDVAVEVEAYRPFFILGEVKNPGQYPYVAGMSVQNAVAIAGGYTPRARTEAVEITRVSGPNRIVGFAASTASVRPGDTINVAERYF